MNKNHAVKCIETGKTYLTISEAAKEYYIAHSAIIKAIKGENRTAGGVHWRNCTVEEERRETVHRILQADPVFMAELERLKELSV